MANILLGGVLTAFLRSHHSRAARAAALSVFELRGAADLVAPGLLRRHAITATNDLVAAAGRVLRQEPTSGHR